MSAHLTNLESQVLQTFAAQLDPLKPMNYALVRMYGLQAFGHAWHQYAHNHKRAKVATSFAFGRLRQKGLIYRTDSLYAQAEQRSWGYWSLTPLGREMLGLPPVPMVAITLSSTAS